LIVLKSPDEIKRMADSCRIVAEVLDGIKKYVSPGVATKELDEFAESFIIKRGARPAFKGYKGYPASVCTSVNEQVVHGIPSVSRLKEGDIISLDIGVYYKGFYGDAAITVPVGKIDGKAEKLLLATEKALYLGIEKAVIGNRLSDVSAAIQDYAESEGFSVVRELVGHGIGRQLHEEPQVPNFGKPGQGPEIKEGMTLAIEPMVNEGGWEVVLLNDGWTTVTKDGSLSAHFEHTIAVTKDKNSILTKL
jgi:methionyl aminopeptidase